MARRFIKISLLLVLCVVACRKGMYEQPKYLPLAENGYFPNGQASRPLPAGAVSHQDAPRNDQFLTGMNGDRYIADLPMPVTRELLERGRQRFEIYCTPCHGYTGQGDGMIVRRGFRPPPSYHSDRLRNVPDGYIFNVITHGYGTMYSYATRVAPGDRWAIVAYIRALQQSENMPVQHVPADIQDQLGGELK